jgi:hypothetical protein
MCHKGKRRGEDIVFSLRSPHNKEVHQRCYGFRLATSEHNCSAQCDLQCLRDVSNCGQNREKPRLYT